MPSSETAESLADDILRGAATIGAFIGLDARQTFYYLQTGVIPAVKEGRIWTTTRSRLRKHYNETRFEPLPKDKEPAAAAPKRKHAS